VSAYWGRRLGLGFAAILAGAMVVWAAAQIATRNAPPRIGGAAPDFTLESTEGQKISLGALRGKPMVVVFVASWCEVCREEMPTMGETFRAHQEHGVVFLGVDIYEDYLVAQQFRKEFQMPFPLLVDAYGEVTKRYRVNGTPTTFFIDRAGIIRDVVVGGPLDRAYLDKEIMPLLKVAGSNDAS
jgi:peroxiredoxin